MNKVDGIFFALAVSCVNKPNKVVRNIGEEEPTCGVTARVMRTVTYLVMMELHHWTVLLLFIKKELEL